MNRKLNHSVLVTFLLLSGLALIAYAQSNIDNTVPNKHAWSENVGWTNWRDAGNPPGNQGVQVGGAFMSGFMWCENIGYINVGNGGGPYANDPGDSTTFGVNIDASGDLHGLAWGENIGWVNFDGGAMAMPPQPARIECPDPPTELLSRLTGYAWGENVGWINLDDATDFVSVDAVATPVDCDMDYNGVPNGGDIALFVEYLLNSGADWRDVCSGDLETPSDGTIDMDDVADFVTCLVG